MFKLSDRFFLIKKIKDQDSCNQTKGGKQIFRRPRAKPGARVNESPSFSHGFTVPPGPIVKK